MANRLAPLQVVGGDFGGGPFASSENLIPTVNPSGIGGGAHFGVAGSKGFGTTSTVNLFSDPAGTAADFRYPLLSSDGPRRLWAPPRIGSVESRLAPLLKGTIAIAPRR